MSRIKLAYKISRPIQVGCAFFATWISAAMCQSTRDQQIYASVAMALSCLASSLFHYGAANRMYARKFWDRVEIQRPDLLVAAGVATFSASVIMGDWLLPRGSVSILGFNAVAVILYGLVLSKRWFTKNVTIAFVCTTPIVLGWWIGSITHPAIFPLVIFACLGYYTREIVKDIQDRQANCGIRVTLPILIGDPGAQWIAGALAAASAIMAVMVASQNWLAGIGGVIMLGVASKLFLGKTTAWVPQAITLAMVVLIIAFV